MQAVTLIHKDEDGTMDLVALFLTLFVWKELIPIIRAWPRSSVTDLHMRNSSYVPTLI